jgi:ribonuclease HI
MVWRVGDGRSIHIWGDKWLPKKVTHEIQSPIRFLDADAKVSDLIDVDARWWNVPMVEAIFTTEKAHAICGLPICPSTQPDKLVWGAAKNGQFSVKSAYHVAMEMGRRYMGSSSSEGSLRGLWRRLWSISGPRVVKLFMWQACNDILPTNENLFKRKVLTEALCPICRSETESVGHALWSCPAAQDVWHECSNRIQKTPLKHTRFLDIFEGLLQRFEEVEVDLFASVARQVWLRRNSWVFEGMFSSPVQVLQRATEQLQASTIATIPLKQHEQPPDMSYCSRPQRVLQKWRKPSAHFLKCNWDAALDVGRQLMGIGLLIRDHEGTVVAAKCSTQSHVSDPLVAETIAVWTAARFIKYKGLDNVVLEGDSLGVVNCLQEEEPSWAPAGHFIEDTKLCLSGLAWSVQHVGRDANSAADRLAKLALSLVEEHQWVSSIPQCIQNIVMAEKQIID